MEDAYDYPCKHCGAVPYTPGPHHKPGCPRNTMIGGQLEDAYEHYCKHCGAVPYTPGPHHKSGCPRNRGT